LAVHLAQSDKVLSFSPWRALYDFSQGTTIVTMAAVRREHQKKDFSRLYVRRGISVADRGLAGVTAPSAAPAVAPVKTNTNVTGYRLTT